MYSLEKDDENDKISFIEIEIWIFNRNLNIQ